MSHPTSHAQQLTEGQLIVRSMQDVVQEIRAQGLTQHVRTFNGESSTKFHDWARDMDSIYCTTDDERMRLLVTRTLSGPAGKFACRLINEKPTILWKELRGKLRDRYSELQDPYCAQMKLRQLKQHSGELVQNFSERLQAVACEAFNDIASDEAQRLLIEVFQKGVSDDRLARSLIRKRFDKLKDAVDFACTEQQTDRTFEMCRGPTSRLDEPMEIDVIRNAPGEDKIDNLAKSLKDLSTKLDKVARTVAHPKPSQHFQQSRSDPNRQQQRFLPSSRPPFQKTQTFRSTNNFSPSQRTGYRNVPHRSYHSSNAPGILPTPTSPQQSGNRPNTAPSPYQWTQDGRPICAFCSKLGHTQRNCYSKNGFPDKRPDNRSSEN